MVKGLGLLRSNLAGGLADQAVVSLGNFGLNIVLARTFSVNEYGVYSVILSFILFLNSLHQALITYPLSVRGAPAEKTRYDYLICVAAVLTPLGALICFPVLGAAVFSVKHLALLPVACCALLAWQLQEVNRRGALARARYAAAIASDVIRYFGTLGVVIVLSASLTIERVFVVLIVSSILAAWPIMASVLRNFLSAVEGIRQEIGIHWRMAAPLLGASLLVAFSTQWFLWLLAWKQGPGGSAILVALANVAAISSPVMFGVENIMVPEIARLRTSLTFPDLMRLLRYRSLVCGALVAPLFLLIVIFPDTVLRLFYGHAAPYAQFTEALRVLTGAYVCYLVSTILSAALRGYQSSETVFKMQLYPALLGVTVGSWLTWEFGVMGACTASLLAGLLRAGTGLYFVLRLRELTVPVSNAIVASSKLR